MSEKSNSARRKDRKKKDEDLAPPGPAPEPGPSKIEGEDPDLADALDSIVAWALENGDPKHLTGLPPLSLSEALEPGTILGDYALVRRIGMGGMGVVFEARQRHVNDRRVALKILRSAFETEDMSQRFKREVAAVACLDHPAIVPVVDARVESGTPYYVMKYVDGASAARLICELRNGGRVPHDSAPVRRLVERIARESSPTAPKNEDSSYGAEITWEDSYPRWIARLGLQIAEALHYAHEHGFLHRDVKPGNVLVTPRGRGVLVDFGLVGCIGEERLTKTGEFLGTLGYASPEQISGAAQDARSDVYSLGATLYELLSLARPFGEADHTELMRRIDRGDPLSLGRDVPLDLRTIVGAALARSPAHRYPTAGAMAADLRAFLAGQPIQARPPGWFRRALSVARRNPLVVAAVSGVLLALVGIRGWDHHQAGERVSMGRSLLQEAVGEHIELEQSVAALGVALAARPRDHRGILSRRLDVAERRERIALGLREARSQTERAFEQVAGFGPAREALADIAAECLRQAFREERDVLAPAEVIELERGLARHDLENRHAALRNLMGRISLTSSPPGARVTIEGLESPNTYRTPIQDLELEEGCYVAVVEAEGRVPARLPFLVRRSAVYAEREAQPSRRLQIELLAPDQIPVGYVYIPAGETLVDDDPPRWEWIPSFLIGSHEVTWAELLRWFREREAEQGERLKIPTDLALTHSSNGVIELTDEVEPDWPVRGATPMDMFDWARRLNDRIEFAPEGWGSFLPRRAEWVRAARGADGRSYPWGEEFDGTQCANYTWGPNYRRDAEPVPIGSRSADVSPFGVFDLAGSAAEITVDLYEPRPGEYVACGGSYWCDDPEQFRVTAMREDENDRPRRDVGFRVVLRPDPDTWTAPPSPFGFFRDDFDRPDSSEVGNDWIALGHSPFGGPTSPHEFERCSIDAGRLVCLGGKGTFSESAFAYHPIQVPGHGFSIRVRLRGTRAPSSDDEEAVGRSYGLTTCHDMRPRRNTQVNLQVNYGGVTTLTVLPPSGPPKVAVGQWNLATETDLFLELSYGSECYMGRAWPAAEDPSDYPWLELTRGADELPVRFVGFMAPNFVEARLEVDWVEVALY